MNDMSDDLLLTPPDERVSAIRDGLFHDVIAAHRAADVYNRERSRAGWWVGGIGAAIGVLGLLTATAVAIAHKPQVRYTEIDDSSGVIHESFGAKDAPDHYPDRTINHYLAEYIDLRERFVWQIDPQTDHRVKLMSAPAEQVRYQADKDKTDPATKYGMNGYARVVQFIPNSFKRRSKGKDKTFEYDVQFIKGELLSNTNDPKTIHMTARIVFQMHPELSMNDQDILDNESGLYVISYNSSAD